LNHEGAKNTKRDTKEKETNGNGHGSATQSSVLLDDLTALDLARMTPLEAIAVLSRLQDRARAMPRHDEQNAYNGHEWTARHE